MSEYLSEIMSLIIGFQAGLIGSWKTIKKWKKKRILRKLVSLKLTLEDIIETAEDIFSSIEDIIQTKKTSKEKLETLKESVEIQKHNLHVLLISFNDPTTEKILKTFNSDLRRNIRNLTFAKMSRISYFIYRFNNLKASGIRKKYNEDFLKDGYNLLKDFKKTSDSFSSFIKEHASIEDIK